MIESFIQSIITNPFILIKIALLILLFFYIAFGVIVYQQVLIMTKIVDTQSSATVILLALFHLLGTVLIFIGALILL